FAPVAGDAIAVGGDVAHQVELVAVARAVQLLLEVQAVRIDLVFGLAADVLGLAIRQRDRSSAGPCAVEAGKRAARLGMTGRNRKHQCSADARSRDSLSRQTEAKQFHIEFPVQNDASIEVRLATSMV